MTKRFKGKNVNIFLSIDASFNMFCVLKVNRLNEMAFLSTHYI